MLSVAHRLNNECELVTKLPTSSNWFTSCAAVIISLDGIIPATLEYDGHSIPDQS